MANTAKTIILTAAQKTQLAAAQAAFDAAQKAFVAARAALNAEYAAISGSPVKAGFGAPEITADGLTLIVH
jgi:hypothetical protein